MAPEIKHAFDELETQLTLLDHKLDDINDKLDKLIEKESAPRSSTDPIFPDWQQSN